jgi:hypothetical protein
MVRGSSIKIYKCSAECSSRMQDGNPRARCSGSWYRSNANATRLSLLCFNGDGGAGPLYQDIVSAVLRVWRLWQRTCGLLCCVDAGLVLGRQGAALAVLLPRGRGAARLLQSIFGGAQPRFQGLELLRLCGHGLLPGRVSTRSGGLLGEPAGAYFWCTFLSRVSRSPSSLNRLSSSDMKFFATVLAVSECGSYASAGRPTIEGGCWASSLASTRGRGSPWLG